MKQGSFGMDRSRTVGAPLGAIGRVFAAPSQASLLPQGSGVLRDAVVGR